ncbi:MAG TPA: ABC transporter permease [Solirubrobacterales bacterium]|nr:ABC transporter permease [Solirubrobacterales bacterium]
MRRWLYPALLIAALIGAWQIAASSGALASVFGIEDFLVPSPAEIASSLWENRSLLAENGWVTLREILLGFVCALTVGLAFAVLMHLSDALRRASYPLVVASQTVPIIAVAPILLVWFGFGIGPKLAIVALVCFFPITVNALDGLRSVDPAAIKLMKTLDASRWQTFQRVEVPTALPQTFTGAKVAAAVTAIAAVFAEWAGSSSGLGHLILQDNANFQTARMFASVALLSAIALALFGFVALVERLVVTWR